MSDVQNPTYFLSPNWSFPPGGRISIGNIIKNPLQPHIYLSKCDVNNPPRTQTSTDKNWVRSTETSAINKLGVWGTFLELVHLKLEANRDNVKSGNYTIDFLETEYLLEDPSQEEIKARCNEPLVKEFMRLDSMLCQPVYMVTGIKVAKGFKILSETSSSKGIQGEAASEVAPEATAGTSAGATRERKHRFELEADGDIVFAYQLAKITPKGWGKEKSLKMSEFHHRQAFLEDGSKGPEEVDGEFGVLSIKDLSGLEKAKTVNTDEALVVFGE